MNITDLVDSKSLRDDIPEFQAGDTVRVHVRVVEGNKERVQVFEGVVIARRGSGTRRRNTVPSFSRLSTSMSPPIERTNSRLSYTPTPMPAFPLVVSKGLNRRVLMNS